MDEKHCSLCRGIQIAPYHRDKTRSYYRCGTCELIFVPERYHLSAAMEKNRYDLHTNHPEDPGYRRFLRRLFVPLNAVIAPGSHGLDFGSGPGPTLSVMFEEAGHRMAIYDPFYADNPEVFDRTYDFITATEVVEHLRAPGKELPRLFDRLKPGGYMGIMTRQVENRAAFATWRYIDDDTHIAFFSRPAFEWLAAQLTAQLSFIEKDVVLLRRKPISG